MTYQRQRPVEILNRNDLDNLFAACNPRTITGKRNRALLAVLYFAGLRIQEALDLRAVDVQANDDGSATLNVRSGKGNKQRMVTLAAPAMPELHTWLTARNEIGVTSKTARLFCTHSTGRTLQAGIPLEQPYVRAMLVRLAKRADIGKRIHAHGFRHSHASYLHHRNVPMAAIQMQLGHSSPLTTVRYLADIGATDAHKHIAQAFIERDGQSNKPKEREHDRAIPPLFIQE